MQADLGGAFYEMAIRDHVRMDVLTRKAAELQRVDAELLARRAGAGARARRRGGPVPGLRRSLRARGAVLRPVRARAGADGARADEGA